MENKKQAQKFRRLVWVGGAIALIIVILAVAASWALYQKTNTLFTSNLRDRLLTISITEAANIDPADLAQLAVEGDYQKPAWTHVVTSLHQAKYTNKDIVYMYIFRKRSDDPKNMEFVADADSIDPYANIDSNPNNNVDSNRDGQVEGDGPDKLQWPGQPYDEAVDIPEAYEAYNGPTTVHDLYSDSYGSVLTGYAPIRNASGTVVAILATDIRADKYFAETQQTLRPFLIFIGFLIFIISILAALLISIWMRQARSLAALDQLKNEFLSIASHQLRAPITAIKGYVSNIREASYGPVPDYLKEPLSIVQESTRVMTSSIEDYLNVSRIEQGSMKYEVSDFNVADLVSHAVGELLPVAENKHLKLTYTGPGMLMVRADIGKVKQVFSNLIDNAIKYTQTGEIRVTLEDAGKFVRFVSVDTGIGIASDEINNLFSKFTRARGANKVNTTGTGLGLYVAKYLIEGQGGKISVRSDGPGKGTQFTVELPKSVVIPQSA